MNVKIKVKAAFRAGVAGDELLLLVNGAAVTLTPHNRDQIFDSEEEALASWGDVGLDPEASPGLLAAWGEGYDLATEKAEIVRPHGGRRHGLNATGKATTIKVTLDHEALARLTEVSVEAGVSRSEIVRRLIKAL